MIHWWQVLYVDQSKAMLTACTSSVCAIGDLESIFIANIANRPETLPLDDPFSLEGLAGRPAKPRPNGCRSGSLTLSWLAKKTQSKDGGPLAPPGDPAATIQENGENLPVLRRPPPGEAGSMTGTTRGGFARQLHSLLPSYLLMTFQSVEEILRSLCAVSMRLP